MTLTQNLGFKINDARPEDASGIGQVFYKTWLATYPNEENRITIDDIEDHYKQKNSSASIEKRKRHILELPRNTKYLVVKDGEKIIGVCRAVKQENRQQLQALYVLPEYQGKGIGYALWQEAEKFFDATKEIYVQVASYNKHAIDLYKKIGFKDNGKRFGAEKFKMKSGNVIPEMEMSISPSSL